MEVRCLVALEVAEFELVLLDADGTHDHLAIGAHEFAHTFHGLVHGPVRKLGQHSRTEGFIDLVAVDGEGVVLTEVDFVQFVALDGTLGIDLT